MDEVKKPYGVVYLIVNMINGKMYVGQTTRDVWERFAEHCSNTKSAIGRAIHKYGKENFLVEILVECHAKEQLNTSEMFFVKILNTVAPKGYNLTTGGKNKGHLAELSKAIISRKNKGKKRSPEVCKKISQLKKGMRLSKETRAKMSTTRKGRAMSAKAYIALIKRNELNKVIVVCLETSEIFESLLAASEQYGICSGEISAACKGKRNTAGKKHFMFLEEWLTADEKTRDKWLAKPAHVRKRVRCVETEEIFSSTREAARKYNTDHKNISRACEKSTRKAVGYHWEFAY